MEYFIYLTTNLITNEKYIGKHHGELNDSYLGSGIILQRAIKKYGKQNFKREILYISKDNEENNLKEVEFITKYNAIEDKTFYNLAPGRDGGDIFHSLPLERRKEIKAATKIRNSGEKNGMSGKHHSEETKEKLRQIDKSYTQTDEYRQNMSKLKSGEGNGMYGKKHTEESKKKMSEAKIGKKVGKENSNAKKISAYKDENMTILVKTFDTMQDALIWIGTKPTNYSGISKRIKINKPYKGYYWKKEV